MLHITDDSCKDAAAIFLDLFNSKSIDVHKSVDLLDQLLDLKDCKDQSKKDAFIVHLEKIKNDSMK